MVQRWYVGPSRVHEYHNNYLMLKNNKIPTFRDLRCKQSTLSYHEERDVHTKGSQWGPRPISLLSQLHADA